MSEFIAKQKQRIGTLRRSLQAKNIEDRTKLARAICNRLPLPERLRQSLFRFILANVIHRSQLRRKAVKKAQEDWNASGEAKLARLLGGEETLTFAEERAPEVSFIVVLRDRAELSILTLESIQKHTDAGYELIIVDNASTDATAQLLDRIRGATIIRNEANLGFGPACMQAAAAARGEYLCFLNNDALLTSGSLSAILKVLEDPAVGAVGGKILLANGDLQEAGSLVWRDGSALGYGRGEDPDAPEYSFRRPVDFCSGVFLVTPRELFLNTGGFSPDFAPAYYEDVDYCMTLWEKGLRVIYEPLALVRHYESASSGGNEYAVALMASQQKKFQNKWRDTLERYHQPPLSNLPRARFAARSTGMRILYVDDRIPHNFLGAGFPRSNQIVSELAALGHHVTCSTFTSPLLKDEYSDIPREIELFDGCQNRLKLVQDYISSSDLMWVSRPHNLHTLVAEGMLSALPDSSRLIYDAEAIFAERELLKSQVTGSEKDAQLEWDEIALSKRADRVVVVSDRDKTTMLAGGLTDVWVLGYALSSAPSPASFADRRTVLFVGAVHGTDGPNADALRFFCESIWPSIEKKTGATLEIVGHGTDRYLGHLGSSTIRVLGPQADLRPFYDTARIFVIPTRYAAGLPFKAHEAASFGVPLVVSGVIARQMNWRDGLDYLVGEDATTFADRCIQLYSDSEQWEMLRANELRRVSDEFSPERLARAVRNLMESLTTAPVR
jgi:O-antigen biosynthesis protein